MLRRLVSLTALALVGIACAEPVPPECPSCSPPSPELAAIAGESFLIRRLTFPVAGARGIAPGLDLDGIDSEGGSAEPSATCEVLRRDYYSDLAPFLGGVDNAGQAFVRTGEGSDSMGRTFQLELENAIARGDIRWIVRLGALPLPGEPARIPIELLVVDAAETIEIDLSDRPVPGQTLRARRVASTEAHIAGSVVWGLVDDGAVDLEVPGGGVFLIPFDDLDVGGLALAAPSELDFVYGNLGGSIGLDALAHRSATELGVPEEEAGFRAIFEQFTDLEPREDNPRLCNRMSVGFGFEAVPVTVLE